MHGTLDHSPSDLTRMHTGGSRQCRGRCLPDGNVLVSQGGQRQSEIYDPATNTWSLDATTPGENNGGQTFLLPDGKVLLAGGDTSTSPSSTAELYTPALHPTRQ